VQSPQRVGPALLHKAAICVPYLGPEQRVIDPSLRRIDVEIGRHDVVIAGEHHRLAGREQARCMLRQPVEPVVRGAGRSRRQSDYSRTPRHTRAEGACGPPSAASVPAPDPSSWPGARDAQRRVCAAATTRRFLLGRRGTVARGRFQRALMDRGDGLAGVRLLDHMSPVAPRHITERGHGEVRC
jgi:hypothetical protein